MLRILTGHKEAVCSVALSQDASILVSSSSDGTVRIWAACSGVLRSELCGHSSSVNSVAITKDGSLVASASDDTTVRIWRSSDGKQEVVLKDHQFQVYSVAFNPDKSKIASGGFDKTVKIWSLSNLNQEDLRQISPTCQTLQGHVDSVFSVAYSGDGSLLTSCGRDKRIVLWSSADGSELRRISLLYTYMRSAAFSPDGKFLVAGCGDSNIILISLSSGAQASKDGDQLRTLSGHHSAVMSVAWSADSTAIASGSGDGTVLVWDAKSCLPAGPPMTHGAPVLSVAAAGGLLAAGDDSGRVVLWSLTGQDRRAAVAMALHPRLGAASGLGSLTADLVARLAESIPCWPTWS